MEKIYGDIPKQICCQTLRIVDPERNVCGSFGWNESRHTPSLEFWNKKGAPVFRLEAHNISDGGLKIVIFEPLGGDVLATFEVTDNQKIYVTIERSVTGGPYSRTEFCNLLEKIQQIF